MQDRHSMKVILTLSIAVIQGAVSFSFAKDYGVPAVDDSSHILAEWERASVQN